jgi:hypothetical protein
MSKELEEVQVCLYILSLPHFLSSMRASAAGVPRGVEGRDRVRAGQQEQGDDGGCGLPRGVEGSDFWCSVGFSLPFLVLGLAVLLTPPSLVGAGSISLLFIVRLPSRGGKFFLARLLFDKMPVY